MSVAVSENGLRNKTAGLNNMPTETKNRTAKASRKGSDSSAARWQSRLAQDHAGEECAERERDAEQLRRPIGDAERDREHREPEQLARAGMRDVVQNFGNDALTDDEHQRDEGKHLGKRNAHGAEDIVEGGRSRAAGVQHAGQSRDQNQREDHREVLHHEPADGDAAALRCHQVAFLQCAGEHDGARDRKREAEDVARAGGPA